MRELEQDLLAVKILIGVLVGKRWLLRLHRLDGKRRRGWLVLLLFELLPLLLGVVGVQISIQLRHHACLLKVLVTFHGVLTVEQTPLCRCLNRELHLALCLEVEEVGVFYFDRFPFVVIFDAEPVPQPTRAWRRHITFVR